MSDVRPPAPSENRSVPVDCESALEDAREELKRTRRELDRLNFFLSHELHAPLRHITSFVGLIEEEIGESLSEDVLTWFGFVDASARDLQEMVNGVLELSRAARATAEPGTIRLDELLDEVAASLRMKNAGEFSVIFDDTTVPIIAAGRQHLKQLFGHLMENSILFAGDAPTEIRVRARPCEAGWSIEVEDTSRGIPEGQLEHVLEAFSTTADSPRTNIGAGLAVCRHLVRLYGGEISIHSSVGVGTRVCVALPAAEES